MTLGCTAIVLSHPSVLLSVIRLLTGWGHPPPPPTSIHSWPALDGAYRSGGLGQIGGNVPVHVLDGVHARAWAVVC